VPKEEEQEDEGGGIAVSETLEVLNARRNNMKCWDETTIKG
jgi:hypothetical protein